MAEFTSLALNKLATELTDFKGGNKENAVKTALHDRLADFCRQDDEFAQAVAQNDKTLSDCAASVMKGAGNSISDLEVYRKGVQFYFPGSEIHMSLTRDLCGSASAAETHGQNNKVLDLNDFL